MQNYKKQSQMVVKKIISKENLKNVFFKIDIEGSEYRLLEELVEFQGMCVD